MPTCTVCGEPDLTRTCDYCEAVVCRDHMLPENHDCEAVRYARTLGPEFRRDFTPDDAANIGRRDPTDHRTLPTCPECGREYHGSQDVCWRCQESSTNRTAKDGSLASRSTHVPRGDLPGNRWRRVRAVYYTLWAWRGAMFVVAAVLAAHFLGLIDLAGMMP